MTEERTPRRPAAILAADLRGHGRLMEQEEAGMLATFKRRRHGILNPFTAGHNGRIEKVLDNGVLVEFASAVNAVSYASVARRVMRSPRLVLRVLSGSI